MQCTAEEIERKRQQALQKLACKNKSPIKNSTSPVQNFYNNLPQATSPIPKYKFSKPSTNHSKLFDKTKENAASKSISQFLGKEKQIIAKCILITEDRFCVELSAFSSIAIDVFKTLPSRNYDVSKRQWSFLISDYEALIAKLTALKGHLQVENFPNFVLKSLKNSKSDLSNIDLSSVEPELLNSLMPFQKEGVAFGVDKGGRCLIADDMGLGKTLQALGIASYYRSDWPLLIVTTASMKNTWEETILEYIPTVPLMQLQYMVTAKDYINDALVLIVSLDMLGRASEKLMERKFGVVIFDESHNLKNFKAKGTQAAKKVIRLAKRVILLSGTPALSRPSELFTQLSLINNHFFGNFMQYSKRYCDGKTTNFGWDASGQSNLQELEIILNKKFMIRRTKDQVLATLPNKSQEIVKLDVKLDELSGDDKACLNALAQKYNSKKGTDKHWALLPFFSETAKIKIPSVLSYILQLLETGQKFLIFAHHQTMMDAIDQILKKKNKKFIRIDGSTTSCQRKYFVDKFQTNDNYICSLLSITAANAGITLTAASLVVFAELHWNPSILSQAESRAHRIGQDKPVIVRYLLAPGTADDSIWPLLEKKQKILIEAGLCKENFNSIEVKNQTNDPKVNLTEGIKYTTTQKTLDISSYFESPNKRQKLNDSVVSELNDSFFENNFDSLVAKCDNKEDTKVNDALVGSSASCVENKVNIDEMLNDGLDDIFLNIDV